MQSRKVVWLKLVIGFIFVIVCWNYWQFYDQNDKNDESFEISATAEFKLQVEFDSDFIKKLRYNDDYKIYTYNQKPILWTYWDNFSTMPPYIRLTFDLMQCHNQPDIL